MQHHGSEHRPIANCNIQLDSIAQAYPKRIKATLAAAKLVEASADLTIHNDIYLLMPLSALHHVYSETMQHFSASKLTLYEIFLDPSRNLDFKHCCNILIPTSYYLGLRKVSALTVR